MSQVDDLKNKLLDDEDKETENKITTGLDLRDPINARKICLNNDYYSLTWVCLKKNIFKNKNIRGEQIVLIPRDYFSLYFQFLIFCACVLVSLTLVLRESILDDVYIVGTPTILICRVILVAYALISMSPEFSEGYAKYFYTSKHQHEFTFPGFAIFVGLMQIICAGVTMTTVAFYVCTADYFGELLTNFSGLCVLAELDDWIGEMIGYNSIQKDDEIKINKIDNDEDGKDDIDYSDLFITENLNDRLSVMEKMSLIDKDVDLELYYNERITNTSHWIVKYIDNINDLFM